MFTLSVFIENESGQAVEGVASVYDSNRALVARESSVGGIARVDVFAAGQMFVSVVAPSVRFSTFTVDVPNNGEGEITVVGESSPKIPPIGPSWCSIEDTIRDVVGRPQSLVMHMSLLSGDSDIDSELVIDMGTTVHSTEDGKLNIHLIKESTYRVSVMDNALSETPSIYTVHVPNRTNARLYDLVYPYPIGGFLDAVFVGGGVYTLTVAMSDGRLLTKFSDVTPYIHSVEADNDEEATLSESEDGGILLSVTGAQGVGVILRGNRRGSATSIEREVAVPGEVFLSLVS